MATRSSRAPDCGSASPIVQSTFASTRLSGTEGSANTPGKRNTADSPEISIRPPRSVIDAVPETFANDGIWGSPGRGGASARLTPRRSNAVSTR